MARISVPPPVVHLCGIELTGKLSFIANQSLIETDLAVLSSNNCACYRGSIFGAGGLDTSSTNCAHAAPET